MKTATAFMLVVVAACSRGGPPSRAPEAPEQPEAAAVEVGGGPRQRWDCVAFVADGDIYVVNLDGTGLTRLTADDACDHSSPAFSPDGTKIAYVSVDKGSVHWAVYVMDADGSDKRRLSPPKEEWDFMDMSPGFTPDGERVVATRTYFPPCSIVIFPSTGGGEEFYLPPGLPPSARGDPSSATFSPDGERVAFYVETGDCTKALWTANADGSGARPLVEENLDSFALSPDWKKVVFCAWTEAGRDIYVVNADGTGRRQLTKGDRDNFSPAFSPDGKKIIYESSVRSEEKHVASDIYIMNADGSGPRALTRTPEDERGARFTPDGSKVVFVARPLSEDDSAEPAVYIMNADGSGRRFLIAGRRLSLGPSMVEGRLLDSYGNWHDVVDDPEATTTGE